MSAGMKVAIVILLLMIILFGKIRSNNKAKSNIRGIARKSLIHESQLRHRKKKNIRNSKEMKIILARKT